MKKIQFFFIAIVLLLGLAWVYFNFFVKPDTTTSSNSYTKDAILYDSLAFERQQQQALIQEKFELNTPQTGRVIVLVESRTANNLLHQKFEIKFGGLMLQGMIGNQSFGVITDLKDSLRYTYDLKKNTYRRLTFAKAREKAAKDKKKQGEPSFDFVANSDSNATKNAKKRISRTADLVNGQSATKISTKKILEEGEQEVNYWYAEKQAVNLKMQMMFELIRSLKIETTGVNEIVQGIQKAIFQGLEEDKNNTIDENQHIIKLSIRNSAQKEVSLETGYDLLNQYFLPFKAKDFSVPEQCKEKVR